jgi:hypothetical protein
MYQLVSQVYKIAPGVLTEHGKTKVRASLFFSRDIASDQNPREFQHQLEISYLHFANFLDAQNPYPNVDGMFIAVSICSFLSLV